MKWQGILAVVASAVCGVSSLAVMDAASAQAAPATGASANPWSKAIEVQGLGARTNRYVAETDTISCASAGNCAATGIVGGFLAFVVSESKGRWGKAKVVPGLGARNKFDELVDIFISCGTAGNCAVGGSYVNAKDKPGGFVASENNGKWDQAIAVPGLSTLSTGKDAELTSLSCSPGRNCVAGGSYQVSPPGAGSFVVSERNGRWGKATPVRGLHPSEFARLRTLSCASAGNCSAGGSFTVVGHHVTGWVASERNGRWGKAIEVPGLGKLSPRGDAETDQVSCASAGNCAAGGMYSSPSGNEQAFVVTEKNGTWGKAIPIPGLATLNAGDLAQVFDISCPAPGNCTIAGTYKDAAFTFQGYVVSEKNGTWGKAFELPNLGKLNKGGDVEFGVVSCVSAGNCVVGGTYLTSPDEDSDTGAFVASENKGAWGKATQVPGLNTLNHGSSDLNTISCVPSGYCAAGGSYEDRSFRILPYVITRK